MGFNRWLGIEPQADGGGVVLDTRPDHLVAPETVHFAVLATLAEVAASLAVAAPVVPTTVALSLLSRARPGRLVGRGRLLRRGRRLAFAEGEVLQGDRLVAKASVTFALLEG
ncbi:MAG TPA: hotdog domain-containing protein [Thermoanaerobaculia bacterium]|nr:hotdog domain-containing protein [Thermoanaerobaculia bacterium]